MALTHSDAVDYCFLKTDLITDLIFRLKDFACKTRTINFLKAVSRIC